jgi:hypothetical protein
MTVSELIKALADFSPSAEIRIVPSIDVCGDRVLEVYGIDARPIRQGSVVIIKREALER